MFKLSDWEKKPLLIFGFFIFFFGFTTQLAWHFHLDFYIQWLYESSPMQYNTALGFTASGLGIIGYAVNFKKLTQIAASAVFLLGGLTFAEYCFNLDLGIDQMLFKPYIYTNSSHIGRIAPNTALSFFAIGVALWISVSNIRSPIRPFLISFLGTSAIGVASIALLGYLIDWEGGYFWGNLTHMAINAAFGIVACGIAICFISVHPWSETKHLFKQWLPVYAAYNLLLIAALLLWTRVNLREEGHIKMISKAESEKINTSIQNSLYYTMIGLKTIAGEELLWTETDSKLWEEWISEYTNSIPGAIEFIWIDEYEQLYRVYPEFGYNLDFFVQNLSKFYQSSDQETIHFISKDDDKFLIITEKITVNGISKGHALLVLDSDLFFKNILKREVNPQYSVLIKEGDVPVFVTGSQIETLNKRLTYSKEISLGGKRWKVDSWPSQESLDSHKLSVSLLIMIYGLAQQFITALSIYLSRVTRQQAEESKRSQIFLQSIINGATTPIYVKNLNSEYMVVNDAFIKLFNLCQKKIIGNKDVNVLPKAVSSHFKRLDQEAVKMKTTVSTEGRVGLSNNDQIYISERFPLYDNEGDILGVCGIATNITEIKKSEQALSDSYKKLETINVQLEKERFKAEQANNAKSAFLATMSHEIRTPLNGIVGITSLLQNTELNEKQEKYVGRIVLSAQILAQLINDILDFSKIEANELTLENTSTDLHQLSKGIVELLNARAQEKGIELSIFLDVGYPSFIFIDSGRLRQIVTNLIGNAIKFTSTGFILLRISSTYVNKKEEKLLFEVIDSGIGIPEEKKDKIFERFSQADSSTTRKFGGTGLGLAISKQLVEKMGGEIQLESEVGVGSQFSFEIPVQTDQEANQKATLVENDSLLSGKSLLLLHRKSIQQKILEDYSSNWEMNFWSTNDLEKGMEVLKEQSIDFVIIDYYLEDINSEQVLSFAKTKGCQCILILKYEDQSDVEELLQQRVQFLSVPIDYLELYTALVGKDSKIRTVNPSAL